jgi:hypothetical protein
MGPEDVVDVSKAGCRAASKGQRTPAATFVGALFPVLGRQPLAVRRSFRDGTD